MKIKVKRTKYGRPKGSKSSSGIPRTSIVEAIELIKKAYDTHGNNLMSFKELIKSMGIPKGRDIFIAGEILQYGFLEKTAIGWRITQLGKNAILGEQNAVIEAIQKNVIFSDLYHRFADENVTQGSIEDYLKKKYRKGEGVSLIASRFLEIKTYIQELEKKTPKSKKTITKTETNMIEILRLMYSMFPREETERDIKAQIRKLIKLAEENEYYGFVNFLDGAKLLINSKDDLKKISNQAIKLFEEESGLTLYPKEKESEKQKEPKKKHQLSGSETEKEQEDNTHVEK